jgi:hypothetical protein
VRIVVYTEVFFSKIFDALKKKNGLQCACALKRFSVVLAIYLAYCISICNIPIVWQLHKHILYGYFDCKSGLMVCHRLVLGCYIRWSGHRAYLKNGVDDHLDLVQASFRDVKDGQWMERRAAGSWRERVRGCRRRAASNVKTVTRLPIEYCVSNGVFIFSSGLKKL